MNLAEIRDFVKESNAIEGIHAESGDPLYDQHIEAFGIMLCDALNNDMPSPRKLHSLLLYNILEEAGGYRKIWVTVGNYKPPAPGLVSAVMQDWHDQLKQDFLNQKTLSEERCWHYHHWFENIHPFEDGNGRAGRLILAQLFLMSGYDLPIVLAKYRWGYYDAIENWGKKNTV